MQKACDAGLTGETLCPKNQYASNPLLPVDTAHAPSSESRLRYGAEIVARRYNGSCTCTCAILLAHD
jgi:hypothetical protein